MSAASDRLAALTGASFENGLHRTALPAAFNDVATVAGEVAATAYDLEAAVAAQNAAGASADSAAASASAAAATIPATLDRTVGRRANDTAIWSMVRSTPAWGFGPTGLLEETAIDTLRWEFNPATLAPLGVAFSGAKSNIVRNPRAQGAVAPSTWPTYWTVNNTASTATVAGTGTVGTIEYVDFDLTFSGAGYAEIYPEVIPATAGLILATQSWTLSSCVAIVAGSLANTTLRHAIEFRNSSSIIQNNVSSSFVPTSALRQYGVVGTAAATVDRASIFLNVVATGAAYLRIRVSGFKATQEMFISPPIFPAVGTPAVSTRAQGTVSIPVRDLGSRYNYRQGVIIADWNSQPGAFTSAADTDFFGIVSLGDLGANEVMGLLINHAHTAALFRRTVGGVSQTTATLTITPPAAGETVRFAMAWDIDAGLMQVAARGAVGAQLTGQTSIPVITHLMPGRFSTTRPLFGRINGLEIRPAAVWGATLAALT